MLKLLQRFGTEILRNKLFVMVDIPLIIRCTSVYEFHVDFMLKLLALPFYGARNCSLIFGKHPDLFRISIHLRQIQLIVELIEPDLQYAIKLLFLSPDNLRHARSRILELRISPLHQIANRKHHLKQKRLLLSQQPPMPNPTPKNLTQHISAPLIRRQHPVINQERSCTSMVRNDAQAGITYQPG